MFALWIVRANTPSERKDQIVVTRVATGFRAIVMKDAEPTVLYVCCGDPRFTSAFMRFAAKFLGLLFGEFVPIFAGGGLAPLAHVRDLIDDFQYLKRQILFFLRHFKTIKKIVVVAHQECGYYDEVVQVAPDDSCGSDQEVEDLPKIATKIRDVLAAEGIEGKEVECYYAGLASDDPWSEFDKVL